MVWTSVGSVGADDSGRSIQGQCYTPGGSPIGAQFQVNTHTLSCQFLAAVSAASDGSLAAAWTSLGSSGNDSSGLSVQARTLAAAEALFVDGFETGDTTAWSSSQP